MKIRIKYKRSTGSIGEFTHSIPTSKVNPNNPQEVDQFVNSFVKGMNTSNEPISWQYLGKPTEHKIKKQKTQKKKHPTDDYNYPTSHSTKIRKDPREQDEKVRQRKIKKYERQKKERRQLRNAPGEYLIVETPSSDVSTDIYKFMKKHHIPHSYTSKRCKWYSSGIHQEYRIEEADPSDVFDAIYYLQGYDPQVVTFDKEFRR